MGRVTNEQAKQNRSEVVAAASKLFRERGSQAVTVAELMAAVGQTHGGFYGQFDSKDALLAEAVGHAFDGLAGLLEETDERHPGHHDDARADLVDYYLSVEHRDDPSEGCPTTGFAADAARLPYDGKAKDAYVDGVAAFGSWLADAPEEGGEDLATLSTLVGALVLARATKGAPISERLLGAAREALRDE